MLCNRGLISTHNISKQSRETDVYADDAQFELCDDFDEVDGEEAPDAAGLLVVVGLEDVLRQSPIQSRVSS